MLVLQVYPVYTIGLLSFKRAQVVPQVLKMSVLVFLLTVVSGVTYVANIT